MCISFEDEGVAKKSQHVRKSGCSKVAFGCGKGKEMRQIVNPRFFVGGKYFFAKRCWAVKPDTDFLGRIFNVMYIDNYDICFFPERLLSDCHLILRKGTFRDSKRKNNVVCP